MTGGQNYISADILELIILYRFVIFLGIYVTLSKRTMLESDRRAGRCAATQVYWGSRILMFA